MKRRSRFDVEDASGNIPVLDWEDCWGKTFEANAHISVMQHCLNVAAVAQVLLDQLPQSVQIAIGNDAVSVAAVHDVGKVSPGFQRHIQNPKLPSSCDILAAMEKNHAYIGAAAINHHLGSKGEPVTAAEVTACHHGNATQHFLSDDCYSMGGPKWAEQRNLIIDALTRKFGPLPHKRLMPAERNLLAGFVTVCDWLGSDERSFNPDTPTDDEDIREIARKVVEHAGLKRPTVKPGLTFRDVFAGKEPFSFQSQVIDAISDSGLYVLEAPTGTGKTEAALFAAYMLLQNGLASGIFFGLPTRLTSNKIHERIQPFLKNICPNANDAQLVHATAWLRAFEEVEGGEFRPGCSWFNNRKRALLNPFGVGTIDQALLSVLRVKHFFVRSFALAGKVVILDEVHTYDMYTSNLMETMIADLRELGCTVIVLSATLTQERRNRLFQGTSAKGHADAYPALVKQLKRDPAPQILELSAPSRNIEYGVSLEAMNADQVVETAVGWMKQGCRVLCIANTVGTAQKWFREISAECNDPACTIGLLHSKFTGDHRNALENRWVNRLGPTSARDEEKSCILVATQVVEQSVDIDADCLITELAPTDMLLQRMGRVWRHSHFDATRPLDEPVVQIVIGDALLPTETDEERIIGALGKRNCKVYSPYVLWRTWLVWRGLARLRPRDDVRSLLENTYDDDRNGDNAAVLSLREKEQAMRSKLMQLAESAKASVTTMPTETDKESVATRYSDIPTVDMLLLRHIDSVDLSATLTLLDGKELEVHADKPNMWITAQLHGHIISIPSYWVRAKPTVPRYLKRHFYSGLHMVTCDTEGRLLQGEVDSGLRYTNTIGLWRDAADRNITWTAAGFDDGYDEFDVFDKKRYDW